MLILKNIIKEYNVADTKVAALKGINIAFRKNEFVSILGPSGWKNRFFKFRINNFFIPFWLFSFK